MRSKRIFLVALLAAFALSTGCAGLVEFSAPAEFKDKKTKEDPPEGWLAPAPGGVRPC